MEPKNQELKQFGDNLSSEQKQIFEEVRKKKSHIFMQAVPPPTLEAFMDWANKEFMGNYGFALKWLWDFYTGGMNQLNFDIADQLNKLNQEIIELKSELEGFKQEKKPKPSKILPGESVPSVLDGENNDE